jgi:hypothetical protein
MSSLKALAVMLFCACLSSSCLYGQSGPCPTSHSTDTGAPAPQLSADLICVVPQVYGPGGLVGNNHGGPLAPTETGDFKHTVHFRDAALASLNPLTAQIGTQLSQLPFASPASGFLFTFNPATGVQTQITQSFGPILSERAQTIGRRKLFVGVSYQYFNFDKIDTTNLRSFGAVYQHERETCVEAGPLVKPCEADGTPLPTKDFLATTNRIDLKVHQVTAVATFGVTNRLDLSVAIPILDVRMSMSSDVFIHSLEGSDPTVFDPSCPVCVHQFATPPNPGESLPSADPVYGFNHAFFSHGNVASGIGDVVLRGKFLVVKAEKAGLAAGLDVRLPSGDAYKFLGSGTYGIRPFAAFSYNGRISPHASIGFQKNGNSVLAGDITSSAATASMPNVFTFSFGADAALTKRISVTADFLGQTLFKVTKIKPSTYTNYCDTTGCPEVTSTIGSFPAIASFPSSNVTQDSIAVGGKVNPLGRLLVTANVLFRVNDAGLHYKPVPLIGLSYTF